MTRPKEVEEFIESREALRMFHRVIADHILSLESRLKEAEEFVEKVEKVYEFKESPGFYQNKHAALNSIKGALSAYRKQSQEGK